MCWKEVVDKGMYNVFDLPSSLETMIHVFKRARDNESY